MDVRVGHAGAEEFDPALALAGGAALAAALVALHVHLAAGLGEGEVVRAEARDGVGAVHLHGHVVQHALQVGEGDVLVDDQALHLVEHRAVGGVHLVLAVAAAEDGGADGQGARLHDARLHVAGLGAQEGAALLVEIEGVRPLAGGVVLVGVQAVEVIDGLLDLGAVVYLKAHADEDVLELVDDDVHRVLVPALDALAGQGDVQRLGLELRFQRGLGEGGLAALELGLELGAHAVGQLADDGALLCGELAHLFEDGGELALLAEVLHPQRLKRFGVRGAGDGGCGFGPELFQHLFHFVSDFPFRSCGTHKKTAPRPIQDERPLFRGTTRYSARDAPHSSL